MSATTALGPCLRRCARWRAVPVSRPWDRGELRTLPRAAAQLDRHHRPRKGEGWEHRPRDSGRRQQILRGPLDKDSTTPSIFPNPRTGKLLGRWKREGDHGGRYTAVGDEFQLCGRSQRSQRPVGAWWPRRRLTPSRPDSSSVPLAIHPLRRRAPGVQERALEPDHRRPGTAHPGRARQFAIGPSRTFMITSAKETAHAHHRRNDQTQRHQRHQHR
jgi:hypothetical protein